jgi:cyclic pyranopterin phosphate synthase
MGFTHVDGEGRARMVDVSHKPRLRRTASAFGQVLLQPQTLRLIRENQIQKGDVLTVAKIAGIAGAKRTAELVPLCHNIEIEQVDLELTVTETSVDIRSHAICTDKTGIEMEALTAVSVAALTIYDMCKAVDETICITDIHLVEKTKEELAG